MKNKMPVLGVFFFTLLAAGCDRPLDEPRVAVADGKAPAISPAAPTPATDSPAAPAAAPADPVGPALNDARGLAYESRANVSSLMSDLDRAIDARVAELTSSGQLFAAGADQRLADARAVAREKADACRMATAETWNTARANLVAALAQVSGALRAMQAGANPK